MAQSVGRPYVQLQILPGSGDPIIPGSLVLEWGAHVFTDRGGVLYRNVSTLTGAGEAVGTVDYGERTATLHTWPAGLTGVPTRRACATQYSGNATTHITFRTAGAPVRPGSLQISALRVDTGAVVTGTADENGVITGGGIMHGSFNAQSGIGELRFTEDPDDTTGASDVPVAASQVFYNAVVQVSLPLSAELLGLDPVRLPADGRVPIYREGDVLVIHHTAEQEVTPVAGSTVTLDRDHQALIEVVDSEGVALDPAQYSTDRESGTLTWANPVLVEDAEGNPLTPPLYIRDRVEHMTLCTDVQITGALGISSPLPWDLPPGETVVSSALAWGDMQARVHRWFTQQTWNSGSPNWTDSAIGNSTTAQYDTLNYPPVVTNKSTTAGRWAIVFTSGTAFQVVEQQLGVIATGNTAADCAPINPATGMPYWTIRKEGWGAGWAAGNAVRFNTDACLGPMWIVRTTVGGQGTVTDDRFWLRVRGDAD